jgi:hypothetical protein
MLRVKACSCNMHHTTLAEWSESNVLILSILVNKCFLQEKWWTWWIWYRCKRWSQI